MPFRPGAVQVSPFGKGMARPPRARNAPILSGGLVWHVVLVATLFMAAVFGIFTYAIDRGYPLALAQTMAMNTLVVLKIFHLFFIRNIHSTSLTWAAARGTRVGVTENLIPAICPFHSRTKAPIDRRLHRGQKTDSSVDGLRTNAPRRGQPPSDQREGVPLRFSGAISGVRRLLLQGA